MVAKSVDSGTNPLLPYEAHTRQLLIEWAATHVHVLLWNKNNNSIEAVESFHGEIADEEDWQIMLGQSRLLPMHDVPVLLLVASARVLPIPVSLYDPERSKEELNLYFGPAMWQHTGADFVELFPMVLAWQMPGQVLQYFRQHFQVITVQHLLNTLLHQPKSSEIEGCLVVSEKHVQCVVRRNGDLVHAGVIPIVTPDDLAYRLLNICRQHDILFEEISWLISGMIESDSALYNGISQFLQSLNWREPVHALPSQTPVQYFAHLLPLLS